MLELREQLCRFSGMAHSHLKPAQTRQKTWYERRARRPEFTEGQQVLLIVPHPQNKLQHVWEGPYKILRKLDETSYVLSLDDHDQ